MKCLENYTIEQIKEMTLPELKVLWDNITEEKQAMDIRATVVDMLEIMAQNEMMEDSKSVIES